jgi:hypothetical protein
MSSSLPISVEEEPQCFFKLLVLSATRLKNIEASHNLDLKVKVEYVEGETSCLKLDV